MARGPGQRAPRRRRAGQSRRNPGRRNPGRRSRGQSRGGRGGGGGGWLVGRRAGWLVADGYAVGGAVYADATAVGDDELRICVAEVHVEDDHGVGGVLGEGR